MDALVFRSRIDPLLAAVIVLPIVGLLGVVVYRSAARGAAPDPILLATFAISLGGIAWMVLTTSYRFADKELDVRSGPQHIRVPLAQIHRVTRSRSLMSAPALSLNRLEIAYGKDKRVLISPHDESAFLTMLKKKAPQATVSVD